jgi:hypothetical protein
MLTYTLLEYVAAGTTSQTWMLVVEYIVMILVAGLALGVVGMVVTTLSSDYYFAGGDALPSVIMAVFATVATKLGRLPRSLESKTLQIDAVDAIVRKRISRCISTYAENEGRPKMRGDTTSTTADDEIIAHMERGNDIEDSIRLVNQGDSHTNYETYEERTV